MPDQHINVQPDAIADSATGQPLLTRERADRAHKEWTAAHPPLPGMRWSLSFNIDGEVVNHRLVVEPGWEDAYAPPLAQTPSTRRQQFPRVGEPNQLGALAYRGWISASPPAVRNSGTPWADLPEHFREALAQAAVVVWQHAENSGFHEALLRTLPGAQLGAAGELENAIDYIAALRKLHGTAYPLEVALEEMRTRAKELRRKSDQGADRARDQRSRQ